LKDIASRVHVFLTAKHVVVFLYYYDKS